MLDWHIPAIMLGLTKMDGILIGVTLFVFIAVLAIVILILKYFNLACWSRDDRQESRTSAKKSLIPPYFLTAGVGDPLGQDDI